MSRGKVSEKKRWSESEKGVVLGKHFIPMDALRERFQKKKKWYESEKSGSLWLAFHPHQPIREKVSEKGSLKVKRGVVLGKCFTSLDIRRERSRKKTVV